ncbi:disulfide bond formation protein B [Cognatilysobacter bugurensis]|uniref:Disulfide bond formation protein B n=1 Tax=Cognatilysobacter bugurensis TaxID=543356 RepID=A0A918T6E1_9GAMM|nr:disulfide bond formation protein B [Lysobacter bugurensis]GHA90586.1 disulfide bond formation protein B [Lysobacter bugurensis]
MNRQSLLASFRAQCALGALACAALLAYALHAQFNLGFEPCPLCSFQRIAFAALGLVFLIGAVHAPAGTGGRRVYGVLGMLAGVAGIAVAGNHVRLQHLPPDQVPACGPGLDYMLDSMPLGGVVQKVMTGSGECANVDWTFLGLSMPGWSLVWFVLLTGWLAYIAFRRPRA